MREHGKKAVVSVYEVPDNILDREFSVLRFDGATKEWLDDCGHMMNMEQPEAFNEALEEFLNDLE